ncbi:cytochrome C [Rhodobacterales bacterium HKCCE2091]|nr:cytochrome C [Rhodobacterales bacterium HKCCE2091]
MRRVILILAACATLGLVGGGAIVGLGLYNVSAQAGHWPGVGWVLHTTFRNSVRLRAPDMSKAPDLSDPDLVALGAGHYASACAPCHAEPGGERTATMRAMEPAPPRIEEAVAHWQPNHLHWIVENGAKMTGMPPWPAEDRGDEVWAVVAYLEAVRVGTAPALPDPGVGGYCATCHGPVGGEVPRLDIQTPGYLERAMRDYATGARPSGIMAHAVSLLEDDEMVDVARYLSGEVRDTPPPPAGDARPGGEDLARRGTRDVPACVACHGPGPRLDGRDRDRFPSLAGQHEAFLATQLTLWRDGVRTGSALMTAAARDLTDEQIDMLASWYSRQPPEEVEDD